MEAHIQSPMRCSCPRGGPARSPLGKGGATPAEFALVSAAFLTLVIGVCYVAIMTLNNMSLEWALTKASRLAKIDNAVSQSDISRAVNRYLASAGLPDAMVVYSSSISGGTRTAYIAASYQRTFVLPILPRFDITFSSNIMVPQPS
jgi:Flp pilus assembly protein TadG